jgi:hypothetical protein
LIPVACDSEHAAVNPSDTTVSVPLLAAVDVLFGAMIVTEAGPTPVVTDADQPEGTAARLQACPDSTAMERCCCPPAAANASDAVTASELFG